MGNIMGKLHSVRLGRVTLLILVAFAALIYGPALDAPFIFDDETTVLLNWTIRDLGRLDLILRTPPGGEATSARPIANLAFALDYAVNGRSAWGYRLTNLVLHVVIAVMLMATIRRTLRFSQTPAWLASRADIVGAVVAILWLVHPINSEPPAYVSPRTEQIVTVFYLLTLYCAIRGFQISCAERDTLPRDPGRMLVWHVLAILCAFLGMGSKEVMVSAPLIVLFYDRAFVSGTFGEAFRRHRLLYVGLALSWGVLVASMSLDPRTGSVGFHHRITALDYLRTQSHVLIMYFKLMFWPDPLSISYGPPILRTWTPAIVPGAVVLLTLALALWLTWRLPRIGFLLLSVFMLLAPSSSFVPLVTEVATERRMYMPSMLILTGVVAAAIFALTWIARNRPQYGTASTAVTAGVFIVATLALAIRTQARAEQYRHPPLLWFDAAAHNLSTRIIEYNLAAALLNDGSYAHGAAILEQTVSRNPHDSDGPLGLAAAYTRMKRYDQAFDILYAANEKFSDNPMILSELAMLYDRKGDTTSAMRLMERATELASPALQAAVRSNYGVLLIRAGHVATALEQFQIAKRHEPRHAVIRANLSRCLAVTGSVDEAQREYETARRLDPHNSAVAMASRMLSMVRGNTVDAVGAPNEATGDVTAEMHFDLAAELASVKRFPEALQQYEQGLQLDPRSSRGLDGLGLVLARLRRFEESNDAFAQAVDIQPDRIQAYVNWGASLHDQGRIDEAITKYRAAIQLRPEHPEAHFNLGNALASTGNYTEAALAFAAATQARPSYVRAHFNYGNVLMQLGRWSEAAEAFTRTTQLSPNFADAFNHLGIALIQTGRPAEALRAFERAIVLRPDYADAKANLERARAVAMQPVVPPRPEP